LIKSSFVSITTKVERILFIIVWSESKYFKNGLNKVNFLHTVKEREKETFPLMLRRNSRSTLSMVVGSVIALYMILLALFNR
jgi:hypothetical protein